MTKEEFERKTLALKMRLLAGEKPKKGDELSHATLLLHFAKLAVMESELENVKIFIQHAAAAIFAEEQKKGNWRDKYKKYGADWH